MKNEFEHITTNQSGDILTIREAHLFEALRLTLIKCGVLRADCSPGGPELLCAAETFYK